MSGTGFLSYPSWRIIKHSAPHYVFLMAESAVIVILRQFGHVINIYDSMARRNFATFVINAPGGIQMLTEMV
jgi:hypothetical protein